MKYLLIPLIALSFNALAISTSNTIHTGNTSTTYNGGSSGVENHASVLTSTTTAPGIYSFKRDRVRGSRNIGTALSGESETFFNNVTNTFNAAVNVIGTSSTLYAEDGISWMNGNYRERGRTYDSAVTPAGTTILRTRYTGNYNEYSNSNFETSGSIFSTFETWE